ncbi:MAG: hypothetical protein KBC22_00235 [Candidatus Pacebacteria bacterium]|nr:hypothetical protein [Candidatus Paceibacterota bacterium]
MKIKITHNEFQALRTSIEKEYKGFGTVRCPFLKRGVVFNAKGLDHIKSKRWNHARNTHDQYTRFKLLHLAPQVIKMSATLQGMEKGNRFERVKVNSRWEQKMVSVSYYEFIAVISDCRVRIIVKQIEGSMPYFWSIVPYWRQTSHRGKKMFEGNSEED